MKSKKNMKLEKKAKSAEMKRSENKEERSTICVESL